MTEFKINLPETFKLQFDGENVIVSNRAGNIVHEMDATNMPSIVDYIRSDPKAGDSDITYVNGFIEDNLLVIVHREHGDW